MTANAIVRVEAPRGRRSAEEQRTRIAALSQHVYRDSLARFFPAPETPFRVCWPGHTAVSSFTHPTGDWLRRPVIHLHRTVDPASPEMRQHVVAELTHAFHFERLPKRKRAEITGRYGLELAISVARGVRQGDGVRSWSARAEQGPVTAFVEALDLFVSAYDSMRETSDRDGRTRAYLRDLAAGAPPGASVPARVAAAIFADSYPKFEDAVEAYVGSQAVTWTAFASTAPAHVIEKAAELHALRSYRRDL